MRRFRPDVVVGTGGYVCGPVLAAAKFSGRPAMLVEQNEEIGYTSRLASKYIKLAAVISEAFHALSADDTLDGVVVGHPAFDTIKRVGADGTVVATPDRAELWVAQTPQVFRAQALRDAHASAESAGFEGTDDASLVERVGGRVVMVEGPRWNLKVTVPEDIEVLEALLASRGKAGGR
jgi:hypothetical protein